MQTELTCDTTWRNKSPPIISDVVLLWMKLWKTNLKIHLGVLGTGNIKLFKNTVFYRVSFRSITKRKFVLLNEQLERQIVQNAYEEMNVNSE